ncbi:hypothetical protein GH714_026804 [Hevea brasiliensis]|uniref:Uncharacterized protein n=1 Tax=Hevea brasiliensis TaxID=3981 RepID=A0A6A6MHG7_HEVBR|nr:hypothetical protein GH714_026804 [Hevea brasiliensis]
MASLNRFSDKILNNLLSFRTDGNGDENLEKQTSTASSKSQQKANLTSIEGLLQSNFAYGTENLTTSDIKCLRDLALNFMASSEYPARSEYGRSEYPSEFFSLEYGRQQISCSEEYHVMRTIRRASNSS